MRCSVALVFVIMLARYGEKARLIISTQALEGSRNPAGMLCMKMREIEEGTFVAKAPNRAEASAPTGFSSALSSPAQHSHNIDAFSTQFWSACLALVIRDVECSDCRNTRVCCKLLAFAFWNPTTDMRAHAHTHTHTPVRVHEHVHARARARTLTCAHVCACTARMRRHTTRETKGMAGAESVTLPMLTRLPVQGWA